MRNKYIVDLSEIQLSDLELVGGKNASLGEMIQNLKTLGVNIPGGFALTVDAYWEFINHNKLDKKIKTMPKKSSEKTKLIYTIANKMQILRLVLHSKKKSQFKNRILY